MALELGMKYLGCGAYQVCPSDDHRMTMTDLQGHICVLMHFNRNNLEKLCFQLMLKPVILSRYG